MSVYQIVNIVILEGTERELKEVLKESVKFPGIE